MSLILKAFKPDDILARDRAHFVQKPSCQSLGFHGQSTALIVVKPEPTFAELLLA